MKKALLFLLVLAFLGTMGVTGLAWAQLPEKHKPWETPEQKLTPIPFPPKTVFVSSQTYVGNLGGLAGADQLCQQLAITAGLYGTYKAWLSDGRSNPNTTFRHSGSGYRLRNGVVIANSWNQLVTSGVLSPIIIDENGRTVTPPPYDPYGIIFVWTGISRYYHSAAIDFSDAAKKSNCFYWGSYSASEYGIVGFAKPVYPTIHPFADEWTDGGSNTCDRTTGHIYCFQQ